MRFPFIVWAALLFLATAISVQVTFHYLDDPSERQSAITYAQKYSTEIDNHIAENIKKIAQNYQLKLDTPDKKRPTITHTTYSGTDEFCSGFALDLKTQINLKFILPVASAQSYDDAVFKNLHSQCLKLDLSKMDRYDSYLEEDEVFYGTANFRGYIADIDNDPANGEEYLLYSERYVRKGFLRNMVIDWVGGVYQAADLKKCSSVGRPVHVRSAFSYKHPQKTGSYNAIVQYKGRNYILDLVHTPRGRKLYSVWLRNLPFNPVCSLVVENPAAVAKREKLMNSKIKRNTEKPRQ